MRSMNGWALAPTGPGVMDGARRRRAKPVAGAAITAMLVAIGLPLAATAASAAVVAGHTINVFPARDFVMAEGYTPGSAHTVKVLRAGSTVGTVNAVANAAGFIEVNHPAVAPDQVNCWVGVTPDIRPGDVIQVLTGTAIESTITAGITLTQTAQFAAATGTVTLKGTAPGATAGTRIPEAQLEIRANAKNSKFAKNQRASLRADSTGTMDGIVSYDAALPSTAWTATFTGMNAVNPTEPDGLTDGARAVNAESIAMSILNLQEITNFEKGPLFVKGPALPDCTAPAATGPTMPVMTPATDTGVSTVDGITKNLTPTFGGVTSTAGATTVNLYVDGVLRGTDTALVGGAYSIAPTTALIPGTHTITAGEVGPNTGGTELLGNAPASITIEVTAPTTTDVTPLNGTPDASQMTNVTATFSEDVFGFTDPTLFTLKAALSGVPVAAQFSYNSTTHTATLTPDAALAPAITYIATLTGGLSDVAGNPLATKTWSFTSGSTPIVLTTLPANTQRQVAQTANVTASFSENVRASVSDTTFTLTSSTGVAVPATVSYDAITNVATLDPTATLAPGTSYTATLTNGIKDLDLNAITATTWSFSTAEVVTRLSDFNRDGNTDLIARDSAGTLWLYPGNGTGGFLTRQRMAGGWNVFNAVVTPGDVTGDGNGDVLARNAAGQLRLYPGNGLGGFATSRLVGASGWNAMTEISAAGLMSGDARPDVLARDNAGKLWLYPTTATGRFQTRRLIGSGWAGMTAIMGAGDLSGDAKADILALDGAGKLWLYRGNGNGRFSTRTPAGTGWAGMTALVTPGNWDRTGGNDVIAKDASGTLWLYPGNNAGKLTARRQIGTGFRTYPIA